MASSAPIGTLQYPYVRLLLQSSIYNHSTSQLTSASFQYTFEQPYLTPYPSSTVESQQWSQYARASIPDVNNMSTYPMAQPLNFFHAPVQNAPNRPRSSPSTFGPSPDNLDWAPSAGLGIQYSTAAVTGQPTPLTSTFPPLAFQTYGASEEAYESSSPPQLQQPQPRRPYQYQPIAPNPAGISASKRQREDEEAAATAAAASFGADSRPTSGNKRRRTTSSATTAAAAAATPEALSEDDRFLIHLKETEALPWKDIAARFKDDKNKVWNVAALQMKYKRLRQRFRVWEEQDLLALRAACEYYEKCKWDIISAKVCGFPPQRQDDEEIEFVLTIS
jgi:hypothetical protein